ncbi:MAG: hypothetical protein A3J30_01790 [Candidatus Wildermuthbacteria bacterium RIFCSPLOWO2_02_FULL_47_9c]|uniref:Uncharacterized protein n=2 Tax=Parcubacteria group TaxID=1794811 RepID=A0A837IM26_9BACT|nr:MAG: hypothetical protein UY25_C0001G0077 [Candidatus Yanofskybacteria bacterium GW2011_GWC1_48_11]KKW03949.1 MAG: hypothetical protein UY38_C0002G0103 [Parcubacteria group bacterium GW2011_GWB1_49_12]KKW08705.1 MAG: hypothetical protein UY45_C0004G0035 [Parcubacteria group bacterium GW2011_GWA1_49_26]KKW13965.1 MAG: hypothetical protein UY53_C0004G0016 [Parcubacteria group bacterium GW2011_GWA2_50_10]OHA61654.1 MAG: hypothetical protein A2109_02835 [Candidatus Wildermuthbacteria bacterium G
MIGTQQEKSFVVSLKGVAHRIVSVRYEKDEGDLKLHFVLREGEKIPREAISIEAQNHLIRPNGIALGGAKSLLINLLKSHGNPQARLLGAVLSKLEYAHRFEVLSALLSKEDFLSAQAEEKILPSVISELKDAFGEQSSYLFLLDSPYGAQGILWSRSPSLRAKFQNIAGGQQKGPWVLLRPAPLSSEQLKHAFLS